MFTPCLAEKALNVWPDLPMSFSNKRMSVGIYPVFSPKLDLSYDWGGEVLADEFARLDELADEHGLTRFSAFTDTRETPRWFTCRGGIAAFESLATLISDNRDAAEKFKQPEAVAEELRAIVRLLTAAAARGSKFRLELN